jgi:hypothetical protein
MQGPLIEFPADDQVHPLRRLKGVIYPADATRPDVAEAKRQLAPRLAADGPKGGLNSHFELALFDRRSCPLKVAAARLTALMGSPSTSPDMSEG